MNKRLEPMAEFFDRRVDGYEEHMMTNVDGAGEYYAETAKWIPARPGLRLLDLGCGTGLELDELYRRGDDPIVTGIDLSAGMLAKLREKHPERAERLRLINASYFDVDFGRECFDAAVSVETMHHFTHDEKRGLYRRLCGALVPGGVYVETDYTAPDQAYEDHFFAEYERLKREQGVGDSFFHFDRPCTVENQIRLLKEAGFARVTLRWRLAGTSIITAEK